MCRRKTDKSAESESESERGQLISIAQRAQWLHCRIGESCGLLRCARLSQLLITHALLPLCPSFSLLNDAVYRPLVPRWGRPGAAMATFAASGLLHAYPLLLLGHGWHAALRMALFFVAQGVLIAAEAVLPTVLHGPVWVTTALCATLPLATSAVLA